MIVVAIAYQLFSPSSKDDDLITQSIITKEQFGERWPLSVNAGIVKCLAIGNGSVVFEVDGKTYAVNGTAKGFAKKHNFYPIENIWLDDPGFIKMAIELAESEKKPVDQIIKAMGTPTKININPVLNAGLELCK